LNGVMMVNEEADARRLGQIKAAGDYVDGEG
jgi:hypothetical protein